MSIIISITPLEALKKAVELAGGQTSLARLCGNIFTQKHVYNWLYRSNRVSAKHAIAIEKALKNQVTRYELRPDIYPIENNSR